MKGKLSSKKTAKVKVFLAVDKVKVLKDYVESKGIYYSDCIRQGMHLEKSEGVRKSPLKAENKKEIQLKVTKEEQKAIRKRAKQELGIKITEYLEGCIDLVLEKEGEGVSESKN